MKGYEILSKVLNDEIKPKTIIKTEHESQYFDDYKTYDYYLVENDKMLHRCDKDGKLGAKFQDRFLNYKVLEKDFEIYKTIEEDKKIIFEEIEELSCDDYDFENKTINLLIRNQKKLIDEINNLKEKKDE